MNDQNINLPPLPEPLCNLPAHCRNVIEHYTRAAVELALQERGEPVAWRYKTPTGWHATANAGKALGVSEHHPVEPLYTAPQPAEPVTESVEFSKEMWGRLGAEPVKVPSDAGGET